MQLRKINLLSRFWQNGLALSLPEHLALIRVAAARTSGCLKRCGSLGSKLKSLSEHRDLWPLNCLHLPGLLLHSALQGLSLEKIAFAMIFKLANAAERRCVAFGHNQLSE